MSISGPDAIGLGQRFDLRFEPLFDKNEIEAPDIGAVGATDKKSAAAAIGDSFDTMLTNAVDKVNEAQVNANEKVEQFIRGEDVSTHEVMIELSKADTTMRLMTSVTNKVIEAYQDIARMQI